MTTHPQINDDNVVFFNRLATLVSNKTDVLPPAGTFFSEEERPEVNELLTDAIFKTHRLHYPNDRPTRCSSFTFEDCSELDGSKFIQITSVQHGMSSLDAEMLIEHLVAVAEDRGDPIHPSALIYATGVDAQFDRVGSVAAACGIMLGGIVVLLMQYMF